MSVKYQEVNLHLKMEEGSSSENKLEEPCNRTGRRPLPIQHHSIFLTFFPTWPKLYSDFFFNSLGIAEAHF